jgi:flagellar assembly protein FliH
MSSRILATARAANAEPIRWRKVGEPDPPAEAAPAEAKEPPTPPAQPIIDILQQRLEEVMQHARALEARCRELEQSIPAKEQAARRAGQQEGEQAAAQRIQPIVEKFTRTITEMAGARARYRKEAEQDVARLSLAVAHRILRRELAVDPDALLGLVKAAMERIDLRETHMVRVHPQDAELVAALMHRIGAPHKIEVVGDSALERGGAVFETARGNLDASVETQLEEIERGFADLFGRKQ